MELKRRLVRLLASDDIEIILAELAQLPPATVLNPLFAGIVHGNETIRWHAITAMGQTVATLAAANMETARVVMRRLMWSLNDESGGIGWGAPEALAEIMACHAALAEEYAHILVSYMREDGNFLELPALQRGVVWGVGRLARVRPQLMTNWRAGFYLLAYLESRDAAVQGLAAWAAGLLGTKEAEQPLRQLVDDERQVRHYDNRCLVLTSVGELARQALQLLAARK